MANDESLAVRKLGCIRAKLYKARLDDIDAAVTLEDPGNYHELTADRKG